MQVWRRVIQVMKTTESKERVTRFALDVSGRQEVT